MHEVAQGSRASQLDFHVDPLTAETASIFPKEKGHPVSTSKDRSHCSCPASIPSMSEVEVKCVLRSVHQLACSQLSAYRICGSRTVLFSF